ncbi:hypothetical protein CesoFtcFv8_003178 [Champsocephalus esox]|uniref:Uncharacterized protein n=1 Tax=Champsocephalus esox TaxID=159716 RepID=A0AAN8HAX5_9TELE|nr:hypothetical protein CesoFtcFv8_003178 [Champsocephalus esox]
MNEEQGSSESCREDANGMRRTPLGGTIEGGFLTCPQTAVNMSRRRGDEDIPARAQLTHQPRQLKTSIP